jgi:hypothetical protein
VTACPTKVVPGTYGFVAQLNEGRYSKKRPTEFRVDQVVQVRRSRKGRSRAQLGHTAVQHSRAGNGARSWPDAGTVEK